MIPVIVELYNKGASNSYGALFIQGFDPNIVAIQGYSSGYPGYSGPTRGGSNFGGWVNGNNYAFNIGGLTGNNGVINFGVSNINGQPSLSFSSFSGANDRSGLFSSLGFTIQAGSNGMVGISSGVVSSRVGAALNPITEGMFSAYGWDNGWLKTFLLEGRNSYTPAGGMDIVEFPATIMTLPPSLEEFRQRVMVTACYDYATHASEMVCIDPEPYSNVKKACKPTTVSLGGGQGGPVSITTIEQRPGRGKTTFVINVRHSKKGTYDELYDYFSLYKCDAGSGEIVKTTDKNIVYIGYVYLSTYDITMTCIPDQVIRLDSSGNGQITCTVEFPPNMASSAYEAPLEVELWYGYSKTIFKDILIRRQN
jgi:hypothetical protein